MKFEGDRATGRAYRKRRAVSEIVSTLLLVAVVVSLGIIVFTFASGWLGTLTGNFTGLISNQGNVVAEHLDIEQATFCFTASCAASCSPSCVIGADVYVRNVGTTASTLVSVYIVDQSTNTFVGQFALTTAQGTLNVGTVLDITHTLLAFPASSLYHGHTYSFTVTSTLGNSVIFYAKAT